MKKHLAISVLTTIVGFGFCAASVQAASLTDKPLNNNLQTEMDLRTSGGTSSVDFGADMLSDATDTAWSITATGGSVNAIIMEIASYATTNAFGIYDLNDPTKILQIFDGAATVANPSGKKTIYTDGLGTFYTYWNSAADNDQITFSSDSFGYYLDVVATGNTFYSDTNLNTGKSDHMFAYQGTGDQFSILNNGAYAEWTPNEYALAFEDLASPNSDGDYTDFVVMVESVNPVPEPTTMLLFGTGLAGLAAVARRKRK